jgi:photosystem II stability/assembly factor-like uncharacterized protein
VNRWTSLGPGSSAVVTALVRDASSPDVLYAATQGGGIFRSEDGGQTWKAANSGLGNGNVVALAADPTAAGTIYAATHDSGVFKTRDGGQTWRTSANGLPTSSLGGSLSALAIDPAHPSTLYVGTDYGFIYATMDGADHWTLSKAANPVRAIAVASDSTVYAIDVSGSIWKSSDRGGQWALLQVFGKGFTSLACDPLNPQTVYAGSFGGIYKTESGWINWTFLSGAQAVTAIAVSSADSKTIVVGSNGNVLVSRDSGSTWKRSTGLRSDGDIRTLLMLEPSTTVMVGRGTALLAGSTAYVNAPWLPVMEGLDAASVATVAVSSAASSNLLATDGLHLLRSADGGQSWTTGDSLGLTGFGVLAYSSASPSTAFAGGSSGILRSDDGGASWQKTILDGAPQGVAVHSFAFQPTSPETAYAATDAGISKSTDGGRHWTRTAAAPTATYAVLADRVNLNLLYEIGETTQGFYGYGLGIEKSTDLGNTWVVTTLANQYWYWDSTGSAGTLAVQPADPLTLYAGTSYGLLKTTDGAASWQAASRGIENLSIRSLATDPTDASILYAGTNRGVYRSTDGAASWLPFNDGLANLAVSALSIDGTGRQLFASTYGGGIVGMEIQPPPSSCEDGEGRACYLGRFLVSASARPPSGNLPPLPVPIRQGERFGSFRLGSDEMSPPDIFLKIVDGRSLPGHAFWIFHAGLTDDDYALTVIDTATGANRVYVNWPNRNCGGIDPAAFPDTGAGTGTSGKASTLSPGDSAALTLYGGRYNVVLSATDPRSGRVAHGLALSQDDRDGYFSLPDFTGDPAFPEVFVRITVGPDGARAFSHTGLTDLAYVLTVTDSKTGAVTSYRNDTTVSLHPCGGSAVLAP